MFALSNLDIFGSNFVGSNYVRFRAFSHSCIFKEKKNQKKVKRHDALRVSACLKTAVCKAMLLNRVDS